MFDKRLNARLSQPEVEYEDPKASLVPPPVQDILDWLEADTQTLIDRYLLPNMKPARTSQLLVVHQKMAEQLEPAGEITRPKRVLWRNTAPFLLGITEGKDNNARDL